MFSVESWSKRRKQPTLCWILISAPQRAYSLLNIEFTIATISFSVEYWIQHRKQHIFCWILNSAPQTAYSLLNIEFSVAKSPARHWRQAMTSVAEWAGTRTFSLFSTKNRYVFRLRWDDPGSIQEGSGGSQEPLNKYVFLLKCQVYTFVMY